MKIICVGRNYVEHIKELQNKIEKDPVIFTKPDTALLRNNEAFYIPNYTKKIRYEVEIVVKIAKSGMSIDPTFAKKYYNEIALGIDFTAVDMQEYAKKRGLPWALAKGFNHSAPIGAFIPLEKIHDINNLSFSLNVNGNVKQIGNTKDMIWNIDELISYISKYILLKKGDLIFTGTPKGVGEINIGDILHGYIEKEKYLDFEIK